MKIHDISMPLYNGMPVWPGDEPFSFKLNWSQSGGASVNVGLVGGSVHIGTHADSPFHVDNTGVSMEKLDPAIFIGPAAVIDVSGHELIEPRHLEAAAAPLAGSLERLMTDAPRLFLRTTSWTDRAIFPEHFATLSEAAAQAIVASGAKLIGVDVPSVDTRDSKSLPIHHTLIGRRRTGAGVQIVEGLVLDAISPGRYDLVALPLNIVGADGAPVRAVLVER